MSDGIHLPIAARFHAGMVSLNGIDPGDFKEWLFLDSMVFEATDKWWGDRGKRDRPHEGIDICYYRDSLGGVRQLEAGAKIPVIFPGRVERIIRDFLGDSVFVSHDSYRKNRSRLFTIFGHTVPASGIIEGKFLDDDDIIGTIADPSKRKLSVLPHLHVSAAWIPDSLEAGDYDWEVMSQPGKVEFIDPLEVLQLPYSVAGSF